MTKTVENDTQSPSLGDPGSPEIMTIPEVARYLKISKAKIYYMVQGHELPVIRIGRNVRIRRSDLEKWLQDHTE